MSFIEDCLKGDALMDEIDEYVDRWSNGDDGLGQELHEYLGMNWSEYQAWGTRPSILSVILRARRNNVSLDRELNQERLALAARAESKEEADRLTAWLKRIGKI